MASGRSVLPKRENFQDERVAATANERALKARDRVARAARQLNKTRRVSDRGAHFFESETMRQKIGDPVWTVN